jgi:sulfite exporter TauE/SafE
MIESLLRIDVVLFVLIGVLGGAHCIGMCGPLVTMYSKQMTPQPDGGTVTANDGRAGHLTTYEVRQHFLFNVGRATTYAIFGAVFGALGSVVFVTADQLTPIADLLRGVVGLAVGGFIVATGVRYVIGGTGGDIRIPGVQRVTSWLATRVHRHVNSPSIVGLGAVHALLPCPMLYPAYLFAFASGSPTTGGIALGALGIGTIPAVFLYGTIIQSIDAAHRRRVHRLLGVVFVVLGYVLFAHGLMSLGVHLPHPMFPHYQPLGGAMGH